MIRINLFVYVYRPVARCVDSFLRGVINKVIYPLRNRERLHLLPGCCIENCDASAATTRKQSMVLFIEGHSYTMIRAGDSPFVDLGPGCYTYYIALNLISPVYLPLPTRAIHPH